MTPTSLLLTLVVIYLLAFIQYWVERPAMSPNARRHNGIVAGLALVTATVILVGIAFASSQRNEGAYRLGSWSFLVLAVPIVQMCALGFRITRILHHGNHHLASAVHMATSCAARAMAEPPYLWDG